ncbi:MAG: glycosyltransferase family 39 protein [Firmicutes bacterium]|nr:glycosyltransferase family 39 protein [Bacillota bacterium]
MWLNWIWIEIIIILSFLALSAQLRKLINNSKSAQRFNDFWDIMEKKYFKHIIALILLIGAAVRLWKFGLIPAGFNQDGAMGAVDAWALAKYGTDRFGMRWPAVFTAWGNGQMHVLLSYLSVPFIAVFGLNRFSARIVTLIISLLALWAIYCLCKLIFGRKTAAVVLAFAAVNPWHIMQSRWAIDCNMFPHFFLFSVYFLYRGLAQAKKYLYISMLFFGITMYSYGIAWYTIPLFLLMVLIYLLKEKRITLKETILAGAAYLFAAWPIFGVMVVNYFKLPSLNTPFFTIPFFPDSIRAGDLLFFSPDFFNQLANNFFTLVKVVVLQKPDLPWNTIPEYGAIYLFSIPFTIIGLVVLIRKILKDCFKHNQPARPSESKTYLYMPVLFWLIIACLSGLLVNVNVNRINLIFYPIIILSGLGISWIARRVKLLSIVIIIIYLIAFFGFTASYFGPHAQSLAAEFFDGFGAAMEYVKDLDYERIYITNWTQYKGSQPVSEILALFYHQVDALYFQDKTPVYFKDGRKMLPYRERYNYVDFEEFNPNPAEKAVYILNNNEVFRFNQEQFNIVRFSYYSAMIPKCLGQKF